MKAARLVSALGLALAAWTSADRACADAATRGAFQFGAGFRYGVEQNEGEVNPWGTGLGLDLGYTMENSVYLGGNFEYFFGETTSLGTFEVSQNVWQLSAEGGYDVGLGESIVIRPKLGLGLASLMVDGCPADICENTSESDFMLAPGATFMLLTRSFSLSLDARYAMIVAEPELAKALIFSLGIGF
jgi:hypothetical protein